MSDCMEVEEDVYIEEAENSTNDSKVLSDDNKRRSALWKYFTVLDEARAKCNFCRLIFSYKTSISNLKIHLARKHTHVSVPGTPYKLKNRSDKNRSIKIASRKRPREPSSSKTWSSYSVEVAEEQTPSEVDQKNMIKIIPPSLESIRKDPNIRDSFMFGCSDFAAMVEKTWYIDKTLFIESVLRECDRLLITAPKRCGRTTLLNMLKKFVEIETDRNGYPIHLDLENGRIFNEHSMSKNLNLFRKTKIFKILSGNTTDTFFHSKHFGRYPVIHISFKDLIGDSLEEVLNSLRSALYSSFKEHKYLLNSRIWDYGYSKTTFQKYIDYDMYDQMTLEKLKNSLKYLSEILCIHFNEKNKVYVMIDDLDTPINNIVFNYKISEEDAREILNIIRGLLTRLMKDNPYVERVLAIANHHYAEILLSDCNVIHKPYLQSDISKYCGFTNEEVENTFNNMDAFDSLGEAKIWYSGYAMTLTDGDLVEMYNNWTVLQHFYVGEFKNHHPYGNFSKFKTILNREEIRDKIEVLVSRRMITTRCKTHYTSNTLTILKRLMVDSHYPICENDIHTFFQLLYEEGYLNLLCRTEETLELSIPNIEMYSEYCKFFFSFEFFKQYYNVTDECLASFADSLSGLKKTTQASFVQLANAINDLFRNTKVLPQNDFELQAPLYHFIKRYFPNIKGDALIMPKRYLKCDIGVPIDSKLGVVMEVTTYDRGTSLDALSQIISNKYNEVLSYDGLVDEVYIGLHLGEDKKITISYLVNNFDLAFADSVTSYDKL